MLRNFYRMNVSLSDKTMQTCIYGLLWHGEVEAVVRCQLIIAKRLYCKFLATTICPTNLVHYYATVASQSRS